MSVLTGRQRDVLHLIATGLHSCEIQARLGIGENTVKFHRRGILGALGARTMPHAVALAIVAGEIASPSVRYRPSRVRSLVDELVAEVSR